MKQKSLEDMAKGLPTDKATVHSYLPVYEQLFYRYQKPIALLEIGVRRGGSLMLWEKYFNRRSVITGIDVKDSTRNKMPKSINLIIGNAYDQSIADTINPQDIIIDDGPHNESSQLAVIDLYLPKLKRGGIMIIEDIPSVKREDLLIDRIPSGYAAEVVDLTPIKGRYDDRFLVIEHED